MHGADLYKANIAYYDHGTLKDGKKILAYVYKLCKPATSEQLDTIRKVYPHMSTGRSVARFAPEMSASVLIFPSKAQLKRQGLK